MRKGNKFYVRCAGMDETLLFKSWDDGYVSISYSMDAFYREQQSVLDRIWKSIKMVFSILVYGEYNFYEIIIEDNESLKELKDFVANLKEVQEENDT